MLSNVIGIVQMVLVSVMTGNYKMLRGTITCVCFSNNEGSPKVWLCDHLQPVHGV